MCSPRSASGTARRPSPGPTGRGSSDAVGARCGGWPSTRVLSDPSRAHYPSGMSMVMAVTFARHGKLYYLDPGEFRPRVGQQVLVGTDEGPEVAQCVWAPQWVSDEIGGLGTMVGFAG